METFYGCLVLKSANRDTKFNQFFLDYRLPTVNGEKTGILEGNVVNKQAERLSAGEFVIMSDREAQPYVMDIVSKNRTYASVFQGTVSNALSIAEKTGMTQAEFSADGYAPLKLSLNLPDAGSVVEQLHAAHSQLEGDFAYTMTHLGTKSRFILGRSEGRNVHLHCVYFDGVHALVWASNVEILDSIYESICGTRLVNRLFVYRAYALQKYRMLVLHPTFLISKFQGYHTSYQRHAENILVFPATERYIARRGKL